MRKMMFNDGCGLTASVKRKAKWKTRRLASRVVRQWEIAEELTGLIGNPTQRELTLKEFALKACPIKVGEIIAVAQPYKTLIEQGYLCRESDGWVSEEYCATPGYHNKMFVKAEYMPIRIKITGVDFERLQDISDEDCLAEGIYERHDVINSDMEDVKCFTFPNSIHIYATPRDAFAALIDKVSGKGTWDSNPYVYVFTFKLID